MATEHVCVVPVGEEDCRDKDGVPCRECLIIDRKRTPARKPNAAPPPLASITADDFAEVLDHAKNRRVRTFSVKTTIKGAAFELSATFEPEPRERKEPERDE